MRNMKLVALEIKIVIGNLKVCLQCVRAFLKYYLTVLLTIICTLLIPQSCSQQRSLILEQNFFYEESHYISYQFPNH